MIKIIKVIGIILAAVAGFFIGMIWYSPILFGNVWMKAIGFTNKKLNKSQGMAKVFLTSFISHLLMAFVIANLQSMIAMTLSGAVMLGIWLWAGFIVTTLINSVLWENQSYKVFLINIGHYLVVLSVMSLIISVW